MENGEWIMTEPKVYSLKSNKIVNRYSNLNYYFLN
jgi:hypothetical protein